MTGKAASKTMGATTEDTRDIDGCDDGGRGREGSQGKRLSLELRLPLSIPPKELGSLDYILSLGHLRFPRTCMRSSPHGAAPYGPKTKGDGRVPPKRGTKWIRDEGRRACAAKHGTKWLRNAGKETWRSRRLSTRQPRTEGTSHWIVRRSTAPTAGHNRTSPAGPGTY